MNANQVASAVGRVINDLDPEFRISVVTALNVSDGTLDSFKQELESATWDVPNLPVEDIMYRIGCVTDMS